MISHQTQPPADNLPLYGKAVAAVLESGERFDREVWVFAGSSALAFWDMNQVRAGYGLILPPGDDPAAYRWPVTGCECLVSQCGDIAEKTLRQLVRCLLAAGACVVRVIARGPDGAPYLTVHRAKEVRHAA